MKPRNVKAIELEGQMAGIIELKNDGGTWELVTEVRISRIKSDQPVFDGLRVVAVATDWNLYLYGAGTHVTVRDLVKAPDGGRPA